MFVNGCQVFKYFFSSKTNLPFNRNNLFQTLAEDDCVIILIGNKTDLCTDDEQRPVKYKDGAKLADVYFIPFFFV